MATKTVRIRSTTHRRLKLSAVKQSVGLNELAEEIIETWLDQNDDSIPHVEEVRRLERSSGTMTPTD
jgi:hypothetical protein